MTSLNFSKTTFIVNFILLIAALTNTFLNVISRMENKRGEQRIGEFTANLSDNDSALDTFVNSGTESELLEKKLEENKRLREEKEELEQEIKKLYDSNKQINYNLSPTTNTWKVSCSSPFSPFESGLVWYAVVGDHNAFNKVKSQYCADALITGGNTQAASFTSYSEAENFAQYLTRETGYNFWVKEPKTLKNYTPSSPSSSSSLSYRSSCGDPFVPGATWYAVIGNSSTLGTIKSNYCGDAIINRNGDAQVTSFISPSRAEEFVSQLESATGEDFWIKKSD